MKNRIAQINVVTSMAIFGTIGIFVKYIPLNSAVIAMFRGMIGVPFLLLVMIFTGKRLNLSSAKKNLFLLIVSGILLGTNWILLFSSYQYTSVAVSTLCYYFAPIILVIVSPFLFHEKMTKTKIGCIIVALIGMIFISGVIGNGYPGREQITGILLALGAAILYATIVTINKKTNGIPSFDKTIIQLFISFIVLIPFNVLFKNFNGAEFNTRTIVLLVLVGIVHTGIAYLLYFGSTEYLPAQSLAILSYIDPVIAVILSALVLHEPLTLYTIIGAVLILSAAAISELKQ